MLSFSTSQAIPMKAVEDTTGTDVKAYAVVTYDLSEEISVEKSIASAPSSKAIYLTLYYDRCKDQRAPDIAEYDGDWGATDSSGKSLANSSDDQFRTGYSVELHPRENKGMDIYFKLKSWEATLPSGSEDIPDEEISYSDIIFVTHVKIDHSFSNVASLDLSELLSGATNLRTIEGMENLVTSEATNMYGMFSYCTSLTSIDLSHFDTSNVKSMKDMFRYCSSLTSIDVSHFNTSNVTNMAYMFQGCRNLKTLDVSHFNTTNLSGKHYLYGMSNMFSGCNNLEELDLSSFTFNENTCTNRMLEDCWSLSTLKIPSTTNKIDNTSFNGVGTEENPCKLIAPENFDFGSTDTSGEWFKWKGGFFYIEGNATAHAGDVNNDGSVDITDLMMVVENILGKASQDLDFGNADINKDDILDINDVTAIAGIILNQ